MRAIKRWGEVNYRALRIVCAIMLALAFTYAHGTTDTLTINVPTGGDLVQLACTAEVDCDTGSEAEAPMTTNDDCAVVPDGALGLVSLTTHCQPYFDASSGTYYVLQWDESANSWLEQNTINMSIPAAVDGGVVYSPTNRATVYPPVRATIIESE